MVKLWFLLFTSVTFGVQAQDPENEKIQIIPNSTLETDHYYVSSNWKLLEDEYQRWLKLPPMERKPWEDRLNQILGPTLEDNTLRPTRHPLIQDLEAEETLKDKLNALYLDGKIEEVEITPELIAEIRRQEEAEEANWEKWLYERERPGIQIAGKITRETLPLGIGGGLGAGVGIGGAFGLAALGVSLPWMVPAAVGTGVGALIYAGLRLGSPKTFEDIPLKISEFWDKKDLVPESVSAQNPKLRFRDLEGLPHEK